MMLIWSALALAQPQSEEAFAPRPEVMALGTLAGASAVGVMGYLWARPKNNYACPDIAAEARCPPSYEWDLQIAALGAAMGAPLGAGITGLFLEDDGWKALGRVLVVEAVAGGLLAWGLAYDPDFELLIYTAALLPPVVAPLVVGLGAHHDARKAQVAVAPAMGRHQRGVQIVFRW